MPSPPVELRAAPAVRLGAAGLAVVLAGLIVAGPAVAVTGAALCAMAVVCLTWVGVAIRGTHIGARAPALTVTDGDALTIEVSVRGPVALAWAGPLLHHDLLSEPERLGGPGRFAITATARGRGYLDVRPPALELSDPFRLVRAARRGEGDLGRLLVLPRTEAVHWMERLPGLAVTDRGVGLGGPTTIDLVGLRDYQPGTPATRIHWPALARGGDLLERVFAAESQPMPLIVVDPRLTAETTTGTLDLTVRAVASLTLELAQRGGVDLLLPGRGTPLRIGVTLATWPAALRALAILEAAPVDALAPAVPALASGLLFYGCCDERLAAAARRRWRDRFITLAPAPLGAGPEEGIIARSSAVLSVAGCLGRAAEPAG